jgi:hypothetical protein
LVTDFQQSVLTVKARWHLDSSLTSGAVIPAVEVAAWQALHVHRQHRSFGLSAAAQLQDVKPAFFW